MSPMAPVKAKKNATTTLTPPSTPHKQGHDPSSFCMATPVKGKNYTKSSQNANVVMSYPVMSKSPKLGIKKQFVKKSLVGPFASRFLSRKCKGQMKTSTRPSATISCNVAELYHEWIVYRDFNKSRGGATCTFTKYLADEISFHRRPVVP